MRLLTQITNRCSLACPHCAFSSADSDVRSLSLKDIRDAVDGFSMLGARDFRFSGGEPFLHFDLLADAMEYAASMGAIHIGCTTNASWATSMTVARRKLGELKRMGLNDLRISCDDFHAPEEYIQRVRNAFAAAVDLRIQVGIKVVVYAGSTNASDIMRELRDLTPDILFFVEELSLLPIGRAAELPEEVFFRRPGIPEGGCEMMGTFALDVEKNVYPCCVPGWPDLLRLGNISRTPVADLVAEAGDNPLYEILRIKGPGWLAPFLRSRGFEVVAGSFVNRCHLCHFILGTILREGLLDVVEEAFVVLEKERRNLRSAADVVKKLWNFD
jgi:MoaA/NifB/PqqE/SkfB family radical SAM enzyme